MALRITVMSMLGNIKNLMARKLMTGADSLFYGRGRVRRAFLILFLPLNTKLNIWAREILQRRLDDSQIKEFQLERLRWLFSKAARIQFWEDIFRKHNFRNPEGLPDIGDIRRLPLLTRDVAKNLVTTLYPEVIEMDSPLFLKTSGSTGQPMSVPVDFKSLVFERSAALSYIFKKLISGNPAKILKFSYDDPTAPGVFLDIYKYADDRAILYGKINTFDPDIAFGILHKFIQLADWSEKDGQKLSIKNIVVSGEQLNSGVRERLERVFGSRVFSAYGSREFGIIGFECQEENIFHLFPERLLLEILDENMVPSSVGFDGKLVITHFGNTRFPFIRYEIGDMGHWVEGICGCGLKTPRFALEGRSLDYLELPDGRRYPLTRLVRHIDIYYLRQIKKFQIIQEAPTKIIIKIVPVDTYNHRHDLILKQDLLGILDSREPIFIDILKVSSIDDSPGGKAQLFVSKLGS